MIRKPAFALLLSTSSLALGLCLFRLYLAADLTYAYMVINLILAWVPFFLSLALTSLVKRKQMFALMIIAYLWVLFYPNALYMVTDFVHLQWRPPIPFWYDAFLLTLFALAGLQLGFLSLYIVERALKKYVNAYVFTAVTLSISSLGIYIGRFLRWNSWDFLTHPVAVFMHSVYFVGTAFAIGFIVATTALSFAVYWLLRPVLQAAVSDKRGR